MTIKYLPIIFLIVIVVMGIAGVVYFDKKEVKEIKSEPNQEEIKLGGGFKVSMAVDKLTGDIIAIKPDGWKWGTGEIEHFLIIKVDLGTGITTWEDAQKLTVPEFETGDLWYPSSEDKDGNPIEQPKVLADRRYKIIDLEASAKIVAIDKATFTFSDIIYDKFSSKKLDATQLSIIKDIGK